VRPAPSAASPEKKIPEPSPNVFPLAGTNRNFVARKIRDPRQDRPQLLVDFIRGTLASFDSFLYAPDLFRQDAQLFLERSRLEIGIHKSFCNRVLRSIRGTKPLKSGAFESTDFLGQSIPLALDDLEFRNAFASRLIEDPKIPQLRYRILPPLAQLSLHQFQISPYKTQVEHTYQITSAVQASRAPGLPVPAACLLSFCTLYPATGTLSSVQPH
jgi:hypothetical protein